MQSAISETGNVYFAFASVACREEEECLVVGTHIGKRVPVRTVTESATPFSFESGLAEKVLMRTNACINYYLDKGSDHMQGNEASDNREVGSPVLRV